MKKLLLFLALLLAIPSFAQATTRYVDINLGSNCSGNYSIASRNCSGSNGDAYTAANVNSAVQASSGGDTILFRAGTYTTAIRDSTYTWPATSAGARLTIDVYNNESVTFVASNTQALAFGGDYTTVRNILFTSTGDFSEVIGIGGNNNRFENVRATGNGAFTQNYGVVVLVNASAHDNLFTGGQYYNPGIGPTDCGLASCDGYPFYVVGSNNTIEYAKIYNFRGYGIHNYHSNAPFPSNNTFRFNEISNGCQVLTTCAGILASSGDNTQIYGNVINGMTGTGVGDLAGIRIGNGATNTKVYNNTIVGSKFSSISWDTSTNITTVKNNLLDGAPRDFYNANTDDATPPPSGTISNNFCDSAGTGCAASGNPLFVNPGAGNFSLQAGSPAINIGTAAIASGITACKNNTNPAAGAIQDLGQPTATVNGTAAVITVPNNCTSQMLPATGVTGYTFKKNGTGDTVTANSLSGTNSYAATLTAFVGGDTCLFSYSQTGNSTSNNNIGGVTTSNQEVFAFTDAACTNITSGGGGTVGLSHWRVYLLQGATDATWTGKCAEDSANCTVAPGSKLWVRSKLRNNSGSTYPTFNYAQYLRYNGGSYVRINKVFTNSIRSMGNGAQLGTVVNEGTTTTPDLLTSDEATNVNGIIVRTDIAIPSISLVTAREMELAQAIEIATTATPGDTYEFCPFTDTGTALTCSTPIKLTVGSYASSR